MADTKRCYFCGERYYRDVVNCPHCGSENTAEIERQKENNRHLRAIPKKQSESGRLANDAKAGWSPDSETPGEPKKEPNEVRPGEPYDLFEGRKR